MKKSKIKSKLGRQQPVLCTQLHLTDPSVYELASLMGIDGIWMDLEHHGYSIETAGELMRAARVGTADIVARPGKGEFMRMARLLELGAQGIMYPRCDDEKEATEVVRWAKFPPLGVRGFDGSGADAQYLSTSIDQYITHANSETFIIIQIENEQALASVDAIAAVPGVDAVMLGPADFSIAGGYPGDFSNARITEGLMTVARAAQRHGKHWARTVGNISQATQALKSGAKILFYHADILMIRRGFEAIQSEFKPLGFSFDV